MVYKLTDEDIAALQSYAAEHGRKWKDKLDLDWYFARSIGERGTILHGLRNNLGPEWLVTYKLPKKGK